MLESNLCREHERAVWGVGKKKEREKEKGREEEGQKGERDHIISKFLSLSNMTEHRELATGKRRSWCCCSKEKEGCDQEIRNPEALPFINTES